jgi:hypothetical protein
MRSRRAVVFKELTLEEVEVVESTVRRGRCNMPEPWFEALGALRVGYQRQLNFFICHLAEALPGGGTGYLCAGVAKRNKHDDPNEVRGERFALQRAFQNRFGVPEGAEPGRAGAWRRSLESLALDEEYDSGEEGRHSAGANIGGAEAGP